MADGGWRIADGVLVKEIDVAILEMTVVVLAL
jgi:hypothetical protein